MYNSDITKSTPPCRHQGTGFCQGGSSFHKASRVFIYFLYNQYGGVYMYRATDLRHKEVINISDGRRIGFVSDVEINFDDGTVEALIVPSGARMLGLIGRDDELVIPWSRIKKIGEDIILVDLDERFIRKHFG